MTAPDWTPLGGNPASGDPTAVSTMAQGWSAGATQAQASGGRLRGMSARRPDVWSDADDADTYGALLDGAVPLTGAIAQAQTDAAAALQAYAAALVAAQQQALTLLVGAAPAQHTLDTIARAAYQTPGLLAETPIGVQSYGPVQQVHQAMDAAQTQLTTARQNAVGITADCDTAARRAVAAIDAAAAVLRTWHGDAHRTASTPPERSLSDSLRWTRLLDAEAAAAPPILGGDARSTAAAWAAIDPDLQTRYITRYSTVVGNADGVPVQARDRANRLVLDNRVAADTARLAAYPPRPEAGSGEFHTYPSRLAAWQAGLDDLTGRLGGSRAIQARLATGTTSTTSRSGTTGTSGTANVFLIGYRPDDGIGNAIVSVGNPDTATDVAVSVPGTGTSLASMGGLMDRSDRMFRATVDPTSTAVITWMGYQAPGSLAAATRGGPAESAAAPLSGFLAALRSTHRGARATVTVVGHSYGATTVAKAAAAAPLDADNVVLLGSPGSDVDSVSDLHLADVPPAQIGHHVYASASSADPVADLPGFIWADDPTQTSWGARVFASDSHPGDFWYTFSDHSSYWNEDSTSLKDLGLIISGEGDSVRLVNVTMLADGPR